MAKVKTPIKLPPNIDNQIIYAINSKMIKEGGDKFELTHEYKYYGQTTLQPGTIFTECNDGFFRIATPAGEVDHYRAKVTLIPSHFLNKI